MAKSHGRSVARTLGIVLAGTLLGAAIAGVFFLYDWRGHPRYAAAVPFQVVPLPVQIGGEFVQPPASPDEMLQVVRRQQFLLEQPAFLQEVLKTDEFHPVDPVDPSKRTTSQWLAENKADPIKALRRDLVLVPDVHIAAFVLTMTAHDPAEAAALAQAAAKVYKSFLENQSDKQKVAALGRLSDALKLAESNFTYTSSELSDYARQKGVDALHSRFDVEKSRLQSLNEDFMKYDAAAASAEHQYEAILRAKNSDHSINLLPELQQSVENDPTLRTLLASQLNWQQEMAAEKSKASPSMDRVHEIEAREAEIDRQIADTRDKLRDSAAARMIEFLSSDATNKLALAKYVSDKRTEEEMVVRSLGQDLMAYQQKVDDLKEQQTLLNKIRDQRAILDANRFTDDTRVQQLIETPVLPKDPVVPEWHRYFPLGAGCGVLLGSLLALGLSAARSRRSAAAEGPVINDPAAPTQAFPVQEKDSPNQ